jgi:hypothetical protein
LCWSRLLPQPTVGVIDYYGLNKVTRDRIQTTLGFKEGGRYQEMVVLIFTGPFENEMVRHRGPVIHNGCTLTLGYDGRELFFSSPMRHQSCNDATFSR